MQLAQTNVFPQATLIVALLLALPACFQEEPERGRTPQAEYTAANPGEWSGLEKTHAPVIVRSETRIQISVPLTDINPGHYIEKIGIMDQHKRDVVPVISLPRAKARSAAAEFEVPPGDGPFKVYAKCNLHDLWTAELK